MTIDTGFVLREDNALKAKLQGIYVPIGSDVLDPSLEPEEDDERIPSSIRVAADGTKTKHVPVYFRLPESEARARVYPYITIDFLTVARDPSREHRGIVYLAAPTDDVPYTPQALPDPDAGGWGQWPIPMTITYQITQFARYNRHDRIIQNALLFGSLQPRFGFLSMGPVDGLPDDNSVRRLDLVSGPTNGDTRDEQGKRVFRKMYTVEVSSELFVDELVALAQVQTVDLSVLELAPESG